MPNLICMLEYLEHVGVKADSLIGEEAIQKEYLRQIYRVDPRNKIINKEGKAVGKASNPRHLVVR